jgi:hypothetical protein
MTAQRVLIGIVVTLLVLQGISVFLIFHGGTKSQPRRHAPLVIVRQVFPNGLPVPPHPGCPSNQLLAAGQSCERPVLATRQ